MPEMRAYGGTNLIRRLKDWSASGFAVVATCLVLAPLVAIFSYLVYMGLGAINWAFLTQTPKPVGEAGGGMANAMVGSGVILLLASVIGIPFGVGTGIYLAEFGRDRFGNVIRFAADVLNGVPSIVMGIAVYGLVVLRQGHFSALAGGIVLGIMMVPTVSRSTEEMLLMVPQNIREAALGLGIPQWRTTISVTLRTANSGIITGIPSGTARTVTASAFPANSRST